MDKNNTFNRFLEIYKLNKIRKAIGTNDPKIVENELFAQFGCFTEKEKIEFEAKYIKSQISKKEYKDMDDVESNKKLIDSIIKNLDNFRIKDISKIRRYLVLIELKYDLNIGLVSEVNDIYEEKVAKMKIYDKDGKTYPVDYVLLLDPEDPGDDQNIKKKGL